MREKLLINGVRSGLFEDSNVAGELEDWRPTLGSIHYIFGSPTFVPINWMVNMQTAVSDSVTESEVISLDTGLLMDDTPALDLWDLVVGVVHSSVRGNSLRSNDSVQDHVRHVTCHKQSKGRMNQESLSSEGLCLEDIDYVIPDVSPVKPLYCTSLMTMKLKLIIKRRSPTMRHASHTHRPELEWFLLVSLWPNDPSKIWGHQKPTR